MKIMFDTSVTMKPYNRKKWWIDSAIIRPITISAESFREALKQYIEYVGESYIYISENAVRTKNEMYVDDEDGNAKQVGYVFTGKSEFQRDDGTWSTQYVDIWVRMLEVRDIDFEEVLR